MAAINLNKEQFEQMLSGRQAGIGGFAPGAATAAGSAPPMSVPRRNPAKALWWPR